jgi:hypothetical protein
MGTPDASCGSKVRPPNSWHLFTVADAANAGIFGSRFVMAG